VQRVAVGGWCGGRMRSWHDPHHPVRRAWSVWVARRCEIAELERRPELAAGAVVQLSSPAAARRWLAAFD
jgi:hypothetical protein